MLTVSASATAAKSVSAHATVSHDGTCQVTLTATIHLDQVTEDLRFPLPGKSSNVTVNGARASSHVENGLRQVNLNRVIGKAVGDFTLNFTYTLPNLIVTNEAGLLELQLPILAGFAYPVQALEFSVTLPGAVTAKPAFSSGYHQANIEKDIYCTTTGATITGVSQVELKDHETLSMSLLVSEEMFPQKRITPPNFKTVSTLTTVFYLLAFAYWALFLRNLPSFPRRRAQAPEGYTAGELGSLLHLRGGDLNMMVFTWAQLGYLQIHLAPNGKVTLQRQMDMGNERSVFEQRCFKQVFGRRNTVDASTLRYGAVYQYVAKLTPNVSSMVLPKSGNLLAFRGLAALAGMFSGISVAIGLSSGAALQWFLVILLGALALLSSWYIQLWACHLFSADRKPVWIALGLCGLWLGLSAIAGQFPMGVGMAIWQLLMGFLAALGGRRTLAGRQAMGETIGLRRYLKNVSADQLHQISRNNPDYFHQMMPYAMALGVDKRFAKRFGKLPIGQCPYISTGVDNTMRASQWQALMRRTLSGMNTRGQVGYWERLLAAIEAFIK
jgi:hypothetical protein